MTRYGIAIILVLSLAQVNIQAQAAGDETLALAKIYPQATSFEDKTIAGQGYWLAKNGKQELGLGLKVEAQGYSSIISMLVGFDREGRIKGIEILSQDETPGLGAKILEKKQGEKKPWFLKQFEGKSPDELNPKNIQAITQASVTSSAVTESVKRSVKEFLGKLK